MSKLAKNIQGILIFSMVSILIFFPKTAESFEKDKELSDDRYVIIISIDGFPSEALWDERIPLHSMRNLANSGVWSTHFVASTPTVTWPNHTTIVTGVHPEKHGLLTNGKFVRDENGVRRSNDVNRSELTTYPAIYDHAYEAGLITAEVNWPVTRNAETMHFSLPDTPNEMAYITPQLLTELVEAGIFKDETAPIFRTGGQPNRDDTFTLTAEHLIVHHQPNLLLFHLLNVDSTHHRFGKGPGPGFTALTLADTHVQRIVNALEAAGIKDQSTIFIVSDHGFMNITKQIHPNVLLKKHGLIELDDDSNTVDVRVQVAANGGSAMVFALNEDTKDEDIKKAYSILKDTEGISRIIKPEEYKAYGLPLPEENDSMGHLLLHAEQHYSFGNSVTGNHIISLDGVRGAHGYMSDIPEMKTIFIASGKGIASGIELNRVDNRSVAPTAAYLLGFEMKTADGEILEKILTHE
jgi:predicted AlkP superfamily pyrophosphatase or phosphodiesterase